MSVYRSLVARSSSTPGAELFHYSKEAPYLVGFNCGNQFHDGCLTLDENVRIHSCEKGTSCSVMKNKPIVWVRPIVAHLPNDQEVAEVGLGGGGDDLEPDIEVEDLAVEDIEPLLQMLVSPWRGSSRFWINFLRISESEDLSTAVKDEIKTSLQVLVASDYPQVGSTIQSWLKHAQITVGIIMRSMIQSTLARKRRLASRPEPQSGSELLPTRITFPYARHSWYPELRDLVDAFNPRDVWPCTVDIARWEERGITMRKLFGANCSSDVFAHDLLVDERIRDMRKAKKALQEDETSNNTQGSEKSRDIPSQVLPPCGTPAVPQPTEKTERRYTASHDTEREPNATSDVQAMSQESSQDHDCYLQVQCAESVGSRKRKSEECLDDESSDAREQHSFEGVSQTSVLTDRAYETRRQAFQAADPLVQGKTWRPLMLISTTDHHSEVDKELGSS
jgi:DNA cross-link repair 1C protein